MPKNSVYKLAVKPLEDTSFSLSSVTSRPRQSTLIDLQLACENLTFEAMSINEKAPDDVERLLRYILTEFFSLFHRSGLYNRQLAFWESLARVSEAHIERLTDGFLTKIELPVWELRLLDKHGQKLVLIRLLDESAPDLINLQNLSDSSRFLNDAIKKAERLKIENAAFAGVILACSGVVPQSLTDRIIKLTGDGAVERYQSLLPKIGCPINLISAQNERFSLVLPYLPERVS